MEIFRKAIPIKELTKSTAVFIQDWDGHDYVIHENDEEYFEELCEAFYKIDGEDERFSEVFDNHMIGSCPRIWRRENLK